MTPEPDEQGVAGVGGTAVPPPREGRWRRRYGASPTHLLLHLVGIGLAALALRQAFDPRYSSTALNLAGWLLGGALLHDLVLLPGYVALDRGLRQVGTAIRPRGWPPAGVPFRGHLRVPAAIAGAALLVYLPAVLGRAPRGRLLSTGYSLPDYAGRWLMLAAGLLALSALVYATRVARALRVARAGARRRSSP